MFPAKINYWAEGPTDRAAARRLIECSGGEPGDDYSGRRRAAPGKDYLDKHMSSFNAAANHAPWLVLRDGDGQCAIEIVERLLPRPAPKMSLRIVVPCIEAWLLADREAFADYLGIEASRLPDCPELEPDPKALVIGIARRSRKKFMREDMQPVPRSGLRVGPGYAGRLIEFISNDWKPHRAAKSSPSLHRALVRTGELAGGRL